MKYFPENIADVFILILLAVWGVYEVFMVNFVYDTLVSIFIGFCLVTLFPWACKKTEGRYIRVRNAALRYSFTFVIAVFSSLKIVEVLRGHSLEVDGMKIIFVGIFLQSAYFLIMKRKLQRESDR